MLCKSDETVVCNFHAYVTDGCTSTMHVRVVHRAHHTTDKVAQTLVHTADVEPIAFLLCTVCVSWSMLTRDWYCCILVWLTTCEIHDVVPHPQGVRTLCIIAACC